MSHVALNIALEHSEVKDLKFLLDRALNCLEPKSWPPLAKPLEKAINEYLERNPDEVR